MKFFIELDGLSERTLEGLALEASDKELLQLLASNPSWFVRLNVARNENTDKETLDILARDPVVRVRKWVYKNPNTAEETKKILSLDPVIAI